MKRIIRFTKKYIFLSNFYPCNVEYEGLIYPSVENAYQAAKTEAQYREVFVKLSNWHNYDNYEILWELFENLEKIN